VNFGSGYNFDRRGVEQAILDYVPTFARQERIARGG